MSDVDMTIRLPTSSLPGAGEMEDIVGASSQEEHSDNQEKTLEELEAIRKKLSEDLEEGECSDDEEEVVEEEEEGEGEVEESVKLQQQRQSPLRKEKSGQERSSSEKERRQRSRSRERHRSRKHKKKREKEKERKSLEELDEDAKKRALLKKLKALEGEMGLVDSEESMDDNDDEDVEDEDEMQSRSPSPRFLELKRKRELNEREMAGKRMKPMRWEKTQICNMFMQGKCPKNPQDCMFSHDAEPPQVWELCKFYLFDRCVKKDKCLYLHKGFPCKYFHTGMQCVDDIDTCKFSHEPLNETTRALLLKHLEAAPKEILGDFPRMTRTEATAAILSTEAQNNGWIPPGKVMQDSPVDRHAGGSGRPGHLSRWDRPAEPPLAVQQAFAMEGRIPDFSGLPGIQGHDVRNRGAFNQGPQPRSTAGLLGPVPTDSPPTKPTGLMDVKINEEIVHDFLQSQKNLKENPPLDLDSTDETSSKKKGDETPDITPPASPPNGVSDSDSINISGHNNLPVTQMKLFQRIQDKQNDLKVEIETSAVHEVPDHDFEDDINYYSDDDGKDVLKSVLKNLNSGNNSPVIGNSSSPMTESTSVVAKDSPHSSPTCSKVMSNSPPISTSSPTVSKPKKMDPRLARSDPRKERLALKEEEDRLEKEKDKRLMELDLGSVFGDLELPPIAFSPKQTDQEKTISDALGLPFKPHIYEVAKEIDASLHSHPPLEWILRPLSVEKPDYSQFKHFFSPSQMELDPRLRRFTKSAIAKMKDLPLPNVPPPTKVDPRLKNKADPRRPPAEVRRSSSEDSDGNQVYNPAKELNKARKAQMVPPTDVPANGRSRPVSQGDFQRGEEPYCPDDEYGGGGGGGGDEDYYDMEYQENQASYGYEGSPSEMYSHQQHQQDETGRDYWPEHHRQKVSGGPSRDPRSRNHQDPRSRPKAGPGQNFEQGNDFDMGPPSHYHHQQGGRGGRGGYYNPETVWNPIHNRMPPVFGRGGFSENRGAARPAFNPNKRDPRTKDY